MDNCLQEVVQRLTSREAADFLIAIQRQWSPRVPRYALGYDWEGTIHILIERIGNSRRLALDWLRHSEYQKRRIAPPFLAL